MENNRPAKDYSTAQLIAIKQNAELFIENCRKRISSQGGWIARDENLIEISKAEGEIAIIDHELSLR